MNNNFPTLSDVRLHLTFLYCILWDRISYYFLSGSFAEQGLSFICCVWRYRLLSASEALLSAPILSDLSACLYPPSHEVHLVDSGKNVYSIKLLVWSFVHSLKKTLTQSRFPRKQSLWQASNANALLEGAIHQSSEIEGKVTWAEKKVESKHNRMHLWAIHSSIKTCNLLFGHAGHLQSGVEVNLIVLSCLLSIIYQSSCQGH